MLATDRLAADLVKPEAFPRVHADILLAARQRLSNEFQKAWIAECCRLVDAGAAASSRNEAL